MADASGKSSEIRRRGGPVAAAWLLAATMLAGGGGSAYPQTIGDGGTTFDPLPPKPAKLMVAVLRRNEGERRFYGQVAARQTVDLAFQVGGQVVSFPAVEGTMFKSGSVLARLDIDPFERAISRATLNLKQAERQVARNEKLLAANAISIVIAQDAETARDLAEVDLQDATEALSEAVLRAPFDGMVAERIVANHTTVTRGQPVVRIHDLSELRVEISVPERLVSAIGDPTQISFEAALRPGGPAYPLQLREFVPQTKSIGQSYLVTLAFVGDIPNVLPGASATVIARLPARGEQGIKVPPTAVLVLPDRSAAVMIFEPAGAEVGRVALLPVKIRTDDGSTIIVTEGLEPGQEFVAAGAHLLRDGQRVRRFAGYRTGD